MGWESISVDDIKTDDGGSGGRTFEPVPAGEYTLQLMGASANKFRPESTDISTAIVDENSEFKGRRIFIDLPSPDVQPWAATVYARLVQALGATVTPFAHPIEELNRLANNGHSRFKASVYVDNYTTAEGKTKSRNKVNYRSIAPAA